jgi:hypothetical protein
VTLDVAIFHLLAYTDDTHLPLVDFWFCAHSRTPASGKLPDRVSRFHARGRMGVDKRREGSCTSRNANCQSRGESRGNSTKGTKTGIANPLAGGLSAKGQLPPAPISLSRPVGRYDRSSLRARPALDAAFTSRLLEHSRWLIRASLARS